MLRQLKLLVVGVVSVSFIHLKQNTSVSLHGVFGCSIPRKDGITTAANIASNVRRSSGRSMRFIYSRMLPSKQNTLSSLHSCGSIESKLGVPTAIKIASTGSSISASSNRFIVYLEVAIG